MGDRPSQREQMLAIASAGLLIQPQQDRDVSLSPEASQIRAARALLNWSDAELAKASGLTVGMIGKIGAGAVQPSAKRMSALRAAFSAAGVILIPAGEGVDEGLGVRLRKAEP